MLARVRAHFVHQPVAYLALFVALGGTAYAAATIGTDDVINDSLLSEDIKNASLTGGDLREGTIGSGRVANDSLTSADVKDDTLRADDILNGTIGSSDIAANSLGGGRITDNSLKGTDIQESSLDLSGFGGGGAVGASEQGTPVASPSNPNIAQHTINVPADGRLLVQGFLGSVRTACGAVNACGAEVGLYVDGVAVPGSATLAIQAQEGTDITSPPVVTWGIADVAAGNRVVTLAIDFRNADNGTGFSGERTSSVFTAG
jgi:hypothetical protein